MVERRTVVLTGKKRSFKPSSWFPVVIAVTVCQVMCHYQEANTVSSLASSKLTVWDLPEFMECHHCPSVINDVHKLSEIQHLVLLSSNNFSSIRILSAGQMFYYLEKLIFREKIRWYTFSYMWSPRVLVLEGHSSGFIL